LLACQVLVTTITCPVHRPPFPSLTAARRGTTQSGSFRPHQRLSLPWLRPGVSSSNSISSSSIARRMRQKHTLEQC
jgi:hypothetical protein